MDSHRKCIYRVGAIVLALLFLAPSGVIAQPPLGEKFAGQSPVLPATDYRALARDIFRELIETDTTHSTGSTTIAAQAAAARRLRRLHHPR